MDHIIEKSFRTEPDFRLPADFAKKLTIAVMRREQWKNDLREYFYLTAVLFILNFILFADGVLLRLLFNRWNRT